MIWKRVSVSLPSFSPIQSFYSSPTSQNSSILTVRPFLLTSCICFSSFKIKHKITSLFHSPSFAFIIMSILQLRHTVNTLQDPICLAKCFLAAGWKACSADLKSGAICYLIGWHRELSVDFSYWGEQGDNGTVSATSENAGARKR